MATSELIQQIFEDAVLVIVNIIDATKRLVFNLSGATAGKTVTIKSNHTDNRVLTLPDRNGTIETEEAEREALLFDTIDYSGSNIRYLNMTHSFTLDIVNPIQGKSIMIEVTPNGFTLSLPVAAKIISGRFKSTTVNYVYFHCIDGVAPTYVVTIGQQIA